MQRYFWSINGRKFSEAQPVVLRYGERVRFRFINETMMDHPMSYPRHMDVAGREQGSAQSKEAQSTSSRARPSTSIYRPMRRVPGPSIAISCIMETGMMRKIEVLRETAALK